MTRPTHNHLKSQAWAAIFMLLLQALLPAIVYASSPKGGYAAEVCTVFGIKKLVWQHSPISSTSSTPDGVAHQQHCPVCSVAHLLALPGSHATFLPSDLVYRDGAPAADSQEYMAIRLRPQVRGPPSIVS